MTDPVAENQLLVGFDHIGDAARTELDIARSLREAAAVVAVAANEARDCNRASQLATRAVEACQVLARSLRDRADEFQERADTLLAGRQMFDTALRQDEERLHQVERSVAGARTDRG